MNNIQALAQIVLLIGGPLLAHNHVTLSSADAQGIAGALLTLGAIVWKFRHVNSLVNSQPVTISRGNSSGSNAMLVLLIALLVPALFVGCANPPVVGHVISVTDTCFGLDVQTTSSPNTTPRVRLGFVRSAIVTEPVVTNTPLNVPDFANNFGLDNTVNTGISLGISESIASGHYQTGAGTNPISSQPIIPK